MEDSGTVSLYLNRLKNVDIIDVKGKKCVVIPVEDNGIYISQKGTMVLSYFMSKMYEEDKYGHSHVLKRKLSKDEYKTMSPEDRKKVPDGGYFSPYKSQGGYSQGQGYSAPQSPTNPSTQKGGNGNNINDLPF